MNNNIYLIGLMGSGKTTVGRKLSALLDLKFIDIDQELIERTGVTIAHIFEVEGEQGFRERESRLLSEVSTMHDTVISTGGGIVHSQTNRDVMANSGKVVYLDVPVETLWNRLKDCQHRPLLQVSDPHRKLMDLMEQRAPLYKLAADYTVRVATDSPMKTARKIQRTLSEQPAE